MRRPEPSGGRGAALRAILGPVLRPVLRWGRRLALGLGGLIAVVLAGGWLWLQSGIADDDGIIVSPALSASVEVLRDAHGVPHIYADNRRDAAFALGVLHARDRLFQMEFMRRLGAGRLSEVVGTATLPLDRFMRTLGVYRLAEAQFDRLTPEHQALTESYAAGVNQVIGELNSGWSKAPPPEFVVLRYRPEPWQPADSLVWGKLMGLLLTDNWQAEMLRQEVISRLGGDAATVLWPENDAAPSTLVNDRSAVLRRHYTPGPYRGDRAHAATAPTVPSAAGQPKAGAAGSTAQLWASLANAVATALPAGTTGGASNAWVIGGGRTQPGAPILANDPHLGFSAPNLWYLAHVETPEGGWAGATVAGVPTPILAQTRDIAWGFTTSNTDAADLYILTLDPQQPDFPGFYVTPSGSAAISGRDEIIRVRGAESERLTVRQTALGPIISDLDEATRRLAGAGQVVALRATFLDADDDSPAALFALAEARSVAEAMTALERFASPAQNAMLADRHGDIGFVTTGRIPLRRNGRDGLLPADAAAVGDDWFDWLPERLRPSERNPERGYIYNANNRVLPPDAAIHLTGFSPEDGFRAARLSVLIGGSHDHELATSTAWQHDSVSLLAQRLLPLLLAAEPADDDGRSALQLLRQWNGHMDRERPEPLIFYSWARHIGPLLWADELADIAARYGPLHPLAVEHIMSEATGWCDDVTTAEVSESCAERNAEALRLAVAELRLAQGRDPLAWRWGEAHQARHPNGLFSRIPGLSGMTELAIPMSGGNGTLLRASPNLRNPKAPYAAAHGAGYRAVYDLGNPARSLFSQATGQSGNPLSRRYGNLLSGWRDGDYLMLFRDRERLRADNQGRLLLMPQDPP